MTQSVPHSTVSKLTKKYNSIIQEYNTNDIQLIKEFIQLDNEDRKDDCQRWMTWFALAGMVFYPLIVVICDALELDKASTLVSDMADMYFISVSAIVMAFFGANAWTKFKMPTSKTDE